MINIYCIAWNEEFLLPYFYAHYIKNFPKANFILYDNESTDNTVKIAKELGFQVITYKTENQLSDKMYLQIKNNCWKNFGSDWVIVCDVDEWLEINEYSLDQESKSGTTLINSVGWNMCNKNNLINLLEIKTGIRSNHYDKVLCFKASEIQEINYSPGAHSILPKGRLQYSNKKYNLLHMKFLDENYMVNRYKEFKQRMSQENIRNKWGVQYLGEEDKIRVDFKNHLEASKNIYEN